MAQSGKMPAAIESMIADRCNEKWREQRDKIAQSFPFPMRNWVNFGDDLAAAAAFVKMVLPATPNADSVARLACKLEAKFRYMLADAMMEESGSSDQKTPRPAAPTNHKLSLAGTDAGIAA